MSNHYGSPASYVQVGRGGVTAYHGQHNRTEGYIGHKWSSHVGPDTPVIDTRTIPDNRICRFAVMGPMCNPDLPAGTVEPLLRDPRPWVDDGSDFGNARSMDDVSLDVFLSIAGRYGATIGIGILPADVLEAEPAQAAWDESVRAKGRAYTLAALDAEIADLKREAR